MRFAMRPNAKTLCEWVLRAITTLSNTIGSREVSEPHYRDHVKCDAWEVVMPELVFEPERE